MVTHILFQTSPQAQDILVGIQWMLRLSIRSSFLSVMVASPTQARTSQNAMVLGMIGLSKPGGQINVRHKAYSELLLREIPSEKQDRQHPLDQPSPNTPCSQSFQYSRQFM